MLGGYYLGQLYLGISGLPAGGTLSPQGSSHQLSSDNITLTQKHLLVVENAIHTLMSENVALTSEQILGINDAFHGLTSTEIQLTQKHTIVVDNTTHSLMSDNLDLVEHKILVVNDTLHGHTVQSVTLSVKSYLAVANALHNHTVQGVVLTQKHTLSTQDALHTLISDSLGGLINIQPDGFGGGWGAIEAWGVKQFGEINIELPMNYLIVNLDSLHYLSSDQLDTFIQIFNMIRTGVYIKDFQEDGDVGDEYTQGTGTVPLNSQSSGNLTPVVASNGFLTVEIGSSGSYEEDDIQSGIINLRNRGQGNLSTEAQDTGIYIKQDNNNGEYEVI